MSGIYGPILSGLTLLVLMVQLSMQGQTNQHTFDQAFVQQANADVAFYLERLERKLKATDSDGAETISDHLKLSFEDATLEQLSSSSLSDIAKLVNAAHSELFSAWTAYMAILAGLKAVDAHPYVETLGSARMRASVVLSLNLCAALDNYVWCLSEGSLEGPYSFTSLPFGDDTQSS